MDMEYSPYFAANVAGGQDRDCGYFFIRPFYERYNVGDREGFTSSNLGQLQFDFSMLFDWQFRLI